MKHVCKEGQRLNFTSILVYKKSLSHYTKHFKSYSTTNLKSVLCASSS